MTAGAPRAVRGRRRPRFRLPPGACDAHCHVFGPGARFPYAPGGRYTPEDAPKETLAALHAHLGVSRAVIVQASCHGTDNAAMLDAIAAAPDRMRGVAIVDDTFDERALERLHAGGVRGVRFNFVRHLGGAPDMDVFNRVTRASRRSAGTRSCTSTRPTSRALTPMIRALPVPFVIDHMGRVDASLGPDQPALAALLELAKLDRCWIKVSGAERIARRRSPPPSPSPPDMAAGPDRVLWGTDFPHPNLKVAVDEADLVDLVPAFAETEAAQRPAAGGQPGGLYGF